MYCGDETGSFIGEIGSHTCRFGYGGEDNPKLTMPSYVVSDRGGQPGTDRPPRRRMSRPSSLRPLRDEEAMESILRMPAAGGDGEPRPWTDPNGFLRQGEVVEHWDNLQTAWEHGMDVLRATDTLKHTRGGTPYDRTKKQKRGHGGVTSATVGGGGEDSVERGRCVHPVLAATPGFSECTAGVDGAAVGPGFQEAVRRQQYTTYTELLMESLDASSVFLAPTSMLAAFSLGRQTALVVDVGAGGCRVTPIVDGLVLKRSQRRSGRGGDWLGEVTWRALLEHAHHRERSAPSSPSSATTTIRPRYMLSNWYEGKKAAAAAATTHRVFHRWAMNDLMYEIRTEPFVALRDLDDTENFRIPFLSNRNGGGDNDGDANMASPPGTPDSKASKSSSGSNNNSSSKNNNNNNNGTETAAAMETTPGSPGSTGTIGDTESATYELPDGTQIDLAASSFGKDLRQLPELFFVDEADLPFRESAGATGGTPGSSSSTLSNLPLHKLIRESLLAVGDVDVRKELAGSICLVGASSLIPNLDKRLSQEMTALMPSFVRPKVVAPKVASVERSCATWIGASVLTSLGSFQQLWLSRTEYEEYGAALSITRFP